MNALNQTAVAAFAGLLALGSPALAHTQAFDLQHSTMRVHVAKQGMFSFLADNHEIDAPIASGSFDADAGSVDVTVDAAKLHVLDPKLSSSQRDQVQSNMTSDKVLDAERYPKIVFRSTHVERRGTGDLKVDGDLTLHGETHPITLDVKRVDATHFHGSTTIRQTAFGITPIRVAGGAVTVKDEVTIDFDVALAQ